MVIEAIGSLGMLPKLMKGKTVDIITLESNGRVLWSPSKFGRIRLTRSITMLQILPQKIPRQYGQSEQYGWLVETID